MLLRKVDFADLYVDKEVFVGIIEYFLGAERMLA